MAKRPLKRMATAQDQIVKISYPYTDELLAERDELYQTLTPNAFSKYYRNLWYAPVDFSYLEKIHSLQMNFCTNPFCKWHGLEQERFETVSNKPYRYKLAGSVVGDVDRFVCNPDRLGCGSGIVLNDQAAIYSNLSVAEEIARLVANSTVVNWEPEIQFHKEDCKIASKTPTGSPKDFYAWGYSTSNSPRFKCKECGKITNMLPPKEDCFTYHQKRNDVLIPLAQLTLSRAPVKRICDTLGIGNKTYYSKLEWINQCCLEFLERHETQKLAKKEFESSLWLNSDQLIYYLNNVRKKGSGTIPVDDASLDDPALETNIIATADMKSWYVFRADVNYDWSIKLKDIISDTKKYHEDHLSRYARKNARLQISYAPQPPSPYDTQTQDEYEDDLRSFLHRDNYIAGLHVSPTYTAIAHYWLIRQLLNVKEWRWVTDQDGSLLTAIHRVFAKEIQEGYAHHFLCKIDRSKTKNQSAKEFFISQNQLKNWASMNGYECFNKPLKYLGFQWMKEELKNDLFEYKEVNGTKWPIGVTREIRHPLTANGSGYRFVSPTTDLSNYDLDHLAWTLLKVNNRATDSFFQEVRRRINTLERPLVTAGGGGEKSYIYANINPKYAQYSINLLRTFYNFCLPIKTKDGRSETPAQRLGIAARKYNIEDILYFK